MVTDSKATEEQKLVFESLSMVLPLYWAEEDCQIEQYVTAESKA
jgi:hypothetical protein